jgi:hypothetical protein
LCSAPATGLIEFASASSRALLKRHLGLENGRIATSLLRRHELRLELGDRVLFVRIARTDNLCLLMLDEHDRRIEKLSTRERQILEEVGASNANEAIALALGIAPRNRRKASRRRLPKCAG